MKLFALASAFFVASSFEGAFANDTRSLQTLATRWNIDDLVVTQNGNEITITATHGEGDGVSGGQWRPYWKQSVTQAAVAGTAPITDACVTSTAVDEGTDNTGLGVTGGNLPTSNDGLTYTNVVDTVGAGTSSVSFFFDSNIQNNPDAYAYDPVTQSGKIVFCFWFGLESDFYVINFREVAFEVEISADGNFQLLGAEAIQIEAQAVQENTDTDIVYPVYAEACEGVPGPVNDVFSIGTPISMCVCTDDYPLVEVTGFQTLRYQSQQGAFGDLTINGNSGAGALYDGTTVDASSYVEFLGCQLYGGSGTKYCCRMDAMLEARFPTYNQDSTVTGVAVTGVVDVGISGRRRQLVVPSMAKEKTNNQSVRGLVTEEQKPESTGSGTVIEEEREFEKTFTILDDRDPEEESSSARSASTGITDAIMAAAVFWLA